MSPIRHEDFRHPQELLMLLSDSDWSSQPRPVELGR